MSEDKIISIVGKRQEDEANADALACLLSWVEMVQSGEITSVAIAGVGPGARITIGHSSWLDGPLLGAVASLQHTIAAKIMEEE